MPTRATIQRGPRTSKPDNRPSYRERGYNYRWEKLRNAFLTEHPLCAECERQGKTTAANCVDHVIPHKGNQELFWDEGNLQALCLHCHAVKTATEDGGWGRKGKHTP